MNPNIPVKSLSVRLPVPKKDPKVSNESIFTIVRRAGRNFPINKARAKKDFSTRNQVKDQKELKDCRGYA